MNDPPKSTSPVLQLEGPPIGRAREPKSETIARLGRENSDLRAVVREECFRAMEFLDQHADLTEDQYYGLCERISKTFAAQAPRKRAKKP